jgi:tetratricopeptide (TPR) repeat protein
MIDYRRKEYRPAIEYWSDLLRLFPGSTLAPSTAKEIGDAYFSLGEYREALSAYQRVKDFSPPRELMLEASLKIYETMFFLGRYVSLTDALQRFIEVNQDSAASGGLVGTTRLRIARIFFDKKEYYRSLAELDKIFEMYPGSGVIKEALVEQARVYLAIGYAEKRKTALRTLIKRKDAGDYQPYAAFELGATYLNELRYDSALYFYNQLLGNAKYQEIAILEIAKIYHTIGQYRESEVMTDKLIADFPASPYVFEAYVLKSRLYRTQGNYQGAIKVLADLGEKTLDRPEVFLELGNVYFEIQDYPSARDNYVEASALFKDNRDEAGMALLLAGDATLIMGDRKSAKDYYLRASLIAKSPSIKNQAEAKLTAVNE